MTELVLVVNAGSSSLKYQLVDVASGHVSVKGSVERIGEADSVGTYREAFLAVQQSLQAHDLAGLVAVGHRVVHGGERFSAPVVVTEEVIAAIEELEPLAPLHNPANLEGIRVATEHLPGVPQVAVFDTAFHHALPAHAYTYAVPRSWREAHAVRRYGFHGTSYAWVSRRAAALLARDLADTRMVVLHLGNGASAAAIDGGRSVDTSMGLTPLEGLVMGTRSGDVDPGVLPYLVRSGMTAEAVDAALNRDSGLLGLSGTRDFRELEDLVAIDDPDGRLAFDVTAYRLRKYVGAYAVALDGLDALVFTAGVGEHSPRLRAAVCAGLGLLGVELDDEANLAAGGGERRISTERSGVAVLVVPTNEELEIARQAADLVRPAER